MRLACLLPPHPGACHPAFPPHLVFPTLQGYLQKVQEHLCLPDRSSLLAEIQALRAQLRMTHLQNQEKLQQLCAALTSTEARGSQREHQLRRQGGCPCSCPCVQFTPPLPSLPAPQMQRKRCMGASVQDPRSLSVEFRILLYVGFYI